MFGSFKLQYTKRAILYVIYIYIYEWMHMKWCSFNEWWVDLPNTEFKSSHHLCLCVQFGWVEPGQMIKIFDYTWRLHDVETASALLALCGLPSQRSRKAGPECKPKQIVQTVKLSLIWDTMTLMWRYSTIMLIKHAGFITDLSRFVVHSCVTGTIGLPQCLTNRIKLITRCFITDLSRFVVHSCVTGTIGLPQCLTNRIKLITRCFITDLSRFVVHSCVTGTIGLPQCLTNRIKLITRCFITDLSRFVVHSCVTGTIGLPQCLTNRIKLITRV